MRDIACGVALALLLGACGVGKKAAVEEKKPEPHGPTGIPAHLRSKSDAPGTPVAAGGNVNAPESLSSLFTPQEDIVYTDPDNPEAPIPELATLLSNSKRGPWEESEKLATQRAIREGKPLLIWFTSSQSSPMCKALSQELFATNDFGNWATENLVRLKVDDFVKVTDPGMKIDDAQQLEYRIKDYNAKLKKQYKVMGYPSLVMLSPNGEVVGRYRGYKRGDSKFLWGQLKQAEAVSKASYDGWRKGMEKKGYREWSDRRDRKIFAKLVSYNKGELVLIEPGGGRAKTKENSLSDKDREWIAEQKKLRQIQ
ncbi:MAG: thioredoxin family protein [Verrucomicrobiota bacterium]